jgi:hypothetical protein
MNDQMANSRAPVSISLCSYQLKSKLLQSVFFRHIYSKAQMDGVSNDFIFLHDTAQLNICTHWLSSVGFRSSLTAHTITCDFR